MGKKIFLVLLSSILSIIIFILSFEIYYKVNHSYETFGAMNHMTWMSTKEYYNVFVDEFTIDPKFGFLPILNTQYYNKYATRVNEYELDKKPGIERLLFIGDSVTSDGNIIKGLKKRYGTEKYEYWNAGVGSYNTVQEVNLYQYYNFIIHPDKVILTFVNYDFDITPIAFFNKPGNLVVYSPKKTIHNISPFLFKNSFLYRMYISFIMSSNSDPDGGVKEATSSLTELTNQLKNKNIEFIVIISPWLKPTSTWTTFEKDYHNKIVQILDNLKIKKIDLSNIIDKAISTGIKIHDFRNDLVHPSDELGDYFSIYLFNSGLLSK